MVDVIVPPRLTVQGVAIDQGELDAAYVAARAQADASGYGRFISDELCHSISADIVVAIENYRNAKPI